MDAGEGLQNYIIAVLWSHYLFLLHLAILLRLFLTPYFV